MNTYCSADLSNNYLRGGTARFITINYLKGRNFAGNLIWRLKKSAYLAGI